MPAPSDSATIGKSGALSIAGPNGTTPRYNVPNSRFNPQTSRGDSLVPVINNVSFDTLRVLGIAVTQYEILVPFIYAVLPAAFWSAAFLSAATDTGTSNFFQITQYPDSAGSAADNFNKCKFDGWSGSISFSTQGAAQVAAMRLTGISIDPYDGTALLAPTANTALSTTGPLGFAQTSYSGATTVARIAWDASTRCQIVPGVAAGGNSAFPYNAAGIVQTGLSGTVTLTQLRSASTVIGSSGGVGTLTVNIGSTGNGMAIAFSLMPLSLGKPSDLGILYQTNTYALRSTDGSTSPITVTAL